MKKLYKNKHNGQIYWHTTHQSKEVLFLAVSNLKIFVHSLLEKKKTGQHYFVLGVASINFGTNLQQQQKEWKTKGI